MDKARYNKIMSNIGWFFFELLIIGHVEDYKSGLSFSLPGLKWHIYIEVKN